MSPDPPSHCMFLPLTHGGHRASGSRGERRGLARLWERRCGSAAACRACVSDLYLEVFTVAVGRGRQTLSWESVTASLSFSPLLHLSTPLLFILGRVGRVERLFQDFLKKSYPNMLILGITSSDLPDLPVLN